MRFTQSKGPRDAGEGTDAGNQLNRCLFRILGAGPGRGFGRAWARVGRRAVALGRAGARARWDAGVQGAVGRRQGAGGGRLGAAGAQPGRRWA
jgi:hypothetical protein